MRTETCESIIIFSLFYITCAEVVRLKSVVPSLALENVHFLINLEGKIFKQLN